jgi:hypothetical protein
MQTFASRITVIQSRKITENIVLSGHMPHVIGRKEGEMYIVQYCK